MGQRNSLPEIVFELNLGKVGRRNVTDICRDLIGSYFKANNASLTIERIVLRPVERLGGSGSLVFHMDVHNAVDDNVMHLIAKMSTKKKAEQELKSAQRFKDVNVSLYRHRSSDNALVVYASIDDAKEFRTLYLDKSVSDTMLVKYLNQLYKSTVDKYITVRPKDEELRSIVEDYDWYVSRRSTNPLARLKSILSQIENSRVSGSENPYLFYQHELLPTRWGRRPVQPFLVHGDLHARNIMVPDTKNMKPELIDYAWGHFGHRAKDFALLEATIKYMLLKEFTFQHADTQSDSYIPFHVYVGFEKQLCAEGLELSNYKILKPRSDEQYSEVPKHMKRSTEMARSGSEYHTWCMSRAYACIRAIRKQASHYLDSANSTLCPSSEFLSLEEEYFLSLFLISIGQAGFSDVEEAWLVCGSGLLAARLKNLWSFNSLTKNRSLIK